MAGNQKVRADDRRGGAKGPNQDAPRGQRRDGTPYEGKAGNVPHDPSPELRRQIEQMAGLQLTQIEIAGILQISPDTIQRHHKEDYEKGKARAGMTLRNRAWQMALGTLRDPERPELGYVPGGEPDRAMIMFLLKTQFGFKERAVHEVVGGSINITITDDDANL